MCVFYGLFKLHCVSFLNAVSVLCKAASPCSFNGQDVVESSGKRLDLLVKLLLSRVNLDLNVGHLFGCIKIVL